MLKQALGRKLWGGGLLLVILLAVLLAAPLLRHGTVSHPLIVSLTSTRQASLQMPTRTDRMYEVWVKEAAVSTGNPVNQLAGAWAMASAYRDGDRQLVLVEDGGVLVYLDTRVLDAPALAAYAHDVAASLRLAAIERGPLMVEAADTARPR